MGRFCLVRRFWDSSCGLMFFRTRTFAGSLFCVHSLAVLGTKGGTRHNSYTRYVRYSGRGRAREVVICITGVHSFCLCMECGMDFLVVVTIFRFRPQCVSVVV